MFHILLTWSHQAMMLMLFEETRLSPKWRMVKLVVGRGMRAR